MKRLGVFGATALSLSLAIATPVLAQEAHGNVARGHAGATMGARGGNANASGARMGGPRMGNVGAQANFRGAQTNVGRSNFAGRGNAQFAQGARGGEFRGERDRGFGRGIAAGAVAAGVATGAAVAYGNNYGYYNDGYYDPNAYGDSYAYDDGMTYDTGLPLVAFDQPQGPVVGEQAMGGDASYCAQRYRSYDPASGTYLGFDGLRHSCP